MKLSKTKLKQIIKEELEGSSRDDAIASLKGLAGVFDKIAQANYASQEDEPGGVDWGYHPGTVTRNIPDPTHGSTIWMTTAEDIEDEYYDELQHAIDMLEDKKGTNPIGPRAVKHAHSINHPMAKQLEAEMTRAVDVALPYMKSLVDSGSGMTENKMKLTKTKLKQIIKEELELMQEGLADIPRWQGETGEPRKEPMTEYELYAHFSPIVYRLGQFKDDIDYAAGLTASSVDTLQLPEKLHSEITRAYLELERLRIKFAQHIKQDPHPHMR